MRQQLRLSKRMERVTWLKLQGLEARTSTGGFKALWWEAAILPTSFLWTQQLGLFFRRSFAEGRPVGFSQRIPRLVTNQTHCFRLKNPCSTFVRKGNAGRIVARLEVHKLQTA